MDSIITKLKKQYRNFDNNKVISEINFKEKTNFEKRLEESTRILEKYPDRVPIICERLTKKVPLLDRSKYLCPRDLSMGNFMYVIRKRLKLDEGMAIYLFINETLVPVSKDLGAIYEEKKDKDGFLYVRYDSETTFG
tara:strand:- start:23 stop:433 length:411 start_codon:yes stop_codon:yes gene_type:complete